MLPAREVWIVEEAGVVWLFVATNVTSHELEAAIRASAVSEEVEEVHAFLDPTRLFGGSGHWLRLRAGLGVVGARHVAEQLLGEFGHERGGDADFQGDGRKSPSETGRAEGDVLGQGQERGRGTPHG